MAAERKAEFAGGGVIKKCPNCGAQIDAFQVQCPACGFEIRGEEEGGSAALKNFLDKYKKEAAREKTKLVNTFPLPNTIEDIIEFALFASQQIKAISRKIEIDNTDIDICTAWSAKLEEARIRAGLSFSKDDPRAENFKTLIEDLMQDVELVNKLSAKQKKENVKQKAKQKRNARIGNIFSGIAITIPALFWVAIIYYGCGFNDGVAFRKETRRLEKLQTEVQYDISAGDYTAAELKLAEFKWTYNADRKEYQTHINTWAAKRELLQKQLEEAKKSGK